MERHEARMTIDERRKYLHKMRLRYWKAKGRKERGRMLDEMEEVTGLHRKSILRLIHGDLARKPRKRERGPSYGDEVRKAVNVIAKSLDYPCAERLQPNLGWMARHLAKHGELSQSAETLEELERVSVSTVRRIVGPVTRIPERLSGVRKPKRGRKRQLEHIPATRIAWDQQEVGHWEVDLVHHSGASSSGQYVHTLQMSDVATGWSECAAILGRSYRVMEDAFGRIQARTPLPIRELHPDNGSEFLNAHLLRFWKDSVQGVEISRSRPYQKNDNRFVEENNASVVRAYLGYQRLDTVAQTILLNQLYDKICLYHNVFQPVLRLQEKNFPEKEKGQRPIRKHDSARPPLDRLFAMEHLDPEQKATLIALRDQTNPLQLRQEIEQLLAQLASLPPAKDGQTQDVFATLGLWKPQS